MRQYGISGQINKNTQQPMYAILFCIASAWGQSYASNIDALTLSTHSKLAHINEEISAVAGYLLASIPVLAMFITKGMVASMGNLANSIMYIPQTAAVHNAESAIKGNYQLGTTSIDTHSYNNTSANKHDDNYHWSSGIKTFSMPSGSNHLMFADGKQGINVATGVSNTAGLLEVDWNKAYGARLDQNISDNISTGQRYASSSVDHATAGYAKLLGFDKNFSQDSREYESWSKGLSADQKASLDEARGHVENYSKTKGLNQQDALKFILGANLSAAANIPKIKDVSVNGGAILSGDASTAVEKNKGVRQTEDAVHDKKFSDSLTKVENLANSNNYQDGYSIANSMVDSAKSDFSKSKSASLEASKYFDRAHSLQESKNTFEQDSTNISQRLTNLVTQEGIKKYGVEGYENIISNNPNEARAFANEVADEVIVNNMMISTQKEYVTGKDQLNSSGVSDIIADHQKKLTGVNKSSEDNNTKVNDAAPKDFIDSVRKNVNNPQVKNQIKDGLTIKGLVVKHERKEAEKKYKNHKDALIDQNNKGKARVMAESFLPDKKDN